MNKKIYEHSISERDEKLIKLGLINNYLAYVKAAEGGQSKRLGKDFNFFQEIDRLSSLVLVEES